MTACGHVIDVNIPHGETKTFDKLKAILQKTDKATKIGATNVPKKRKISVNKLV